MKKYISFGEYNKLYNHIWYYVFTKYIYDYALGDILEKKAIKIIDFPKDILIQQAFNYFISFIGSMLLFFYENKQDLPIYNQSHSSYNKKISNNNLESIQNDLWEDKNFRYMIILLSYFFFCVCNYLKHLLFLV